MLADDVVRDRKPQPCSLVGWLGGEERVEYLVDRLLGDAAPIVPDTNLHRFIRALRREHHLGHELLTFRFLRFPLLIHGVAGVAHHVEEDAAQITRDGFHFTCIGIELLPDGELEVRVQRPGAVVGQRGMFVDEVVDVDGTRFTPASAHHQHVLDDAVRPFAVRLDTLQVTGQIGGYLFDVLLLVLRQRVAGVIDRFLQLHE